MNKKEAPVIQVKQKEETPLNEIKEGNNDNKMKEKSLEEEINIFEVILDTIGDSKTHGVSNIVKAKSKILKLIWLICLLASAGYCMYELVIAVMAYLQYGVVLTITPIYEAPTNFIAVQICNNIAYDNQAISSYVTNITNQYNITLNTFSTLKQYTDTVSALVKSKLAKQAQSGAFNSFQAGYNLENMMISCFYDGNACSQKDFFYQNDFNYGDCFSFNLGSINNAGYSPLNSTPPIVQSSFTGAANGLQLELFVGSPANQALTYGSGIRVTVYNQSTIPFPKDMGITVPTGMQTDIIVSRSFIYHLGQPYSNCLSDPVDYTQNSVLQTLLNNYTLSNGVTQVYKQSYCLKVCLQQYIINQCGCYDLSFTMQNWNSSGGLRGCYEDADLICYQQQYTNFINNNQDVVCYAMCPLECNEIILDTQTTYATYPALWYANLMLNNTAFINMVQQTAPANTTIDYSFVAANTLLVNVFYDKMGYSCTQESPAMTVDALIATFGGNVGLFLGVTFLSLVEFVEIFFYMIYYNILRLTKKKTSPSKIEV
jgi:hypothetical protein